MAETTTEFAIRLSVEGDPEAAHDAVEAALDAGSLQEYVEDHGLDNGASLSVKSAVIRYADQRPRELTLEDVTVALEAEEEEEPVRGHFATDEPELDRKEEERILRRLEAGDRWAWFCAKVTVTWNGMSGTDCLGCCSYESEESFRKDGYYDGMVEEALAELNRKVAGAWAEIAPLIA